MWYRISAYAMALIAVTVVGVFADDVDAVHNELTRAKTAYDDAITKANNSLADAFDARIKEVAATGNLDAVKKLIADKEAFETEGTLPGSRDMKAAATQHQQAIKKARETMESAYDKAVRQYTKDLNVNKADFTKTEWEVFKARGKDTAPRASSPARLVIHAAFYGQNVNWIDVTEKLRDVVSDKREWSTVVNTSDWGDPAPGYTGPRTLIVRYTIDGVTASKWQYQGKELVIP